MAEGRLKAFKDVLRWNNQWMVGERAARIRAARVMHSRYPTTRYQEMAEEVLVRALAGVMRR